MSAGKEDKVGANERVINLADSLKAIVDKEALDASTLNVCFRLDANDKLQPMADRKGIVLYDGKKFADWTLPSIRALFRGVRRPPPDSEMSHYPAEYVRFFYGVEKNIASFACKDFAPYDHEFIEVYSAMRRRPDGKSCGLLHDIVWQSTALVLGLREWSEAEYTAVFLQLERSARHFQVGSSSRNYLNYISGSLG